MIYIVLVLERLNKHVEDKKPAPMFNNLKYSLNNVLFIQYLTKLN